MNSYGLADMEQLACSSEAGWRRCAATPTAAETMLAGADRSARHRGSPGPDPGSVWRAHSPPPPAASRETALNGAQAGLAHAHVLGVSSGSLRWGWPLAARMAHDWANAAVGDLTALLESHPPGQGFPMLQGRTRPGPGPPRRSNGDGQPARAAFAAPSTAYASARPPSIWPTACLTRPSTSPATSVPRCRAGCRRSPRHRSPAALPAPA